MREASQYKYSDVLHHLTNPYIYIFRVRWQRWGLPSAYVSNSTRVGCDFFFIHRAGLLLEGAQTGGRIFRNTLWNAFFTGETFLIFDFLSLYEQNAWKVTHVSRKSTRMWLAIGERGLESLHLLLPFHCLFLSANAGADASASGGRGECVWGQRRMCLGAEADADGAKFADKLGIWVYEASGGDARCESGLSCIKPVGPVWQANPDWQAAYLHPYRTFQIQCELRAEYQT